jgi:hypothetical protein
VKGRDTVKAILARHGEQRLNPQEFEREFGSLPTDDSGLIDERESAGAERLSCWFLNLFCQVPLKDSAHAEEAAQLERSCGR